MNHKITFLWFAFGHKFHNTLFPIKEKKQTHLRLHYRNENIYLMHISIVLNYKWMNYSFKNYIIKELQFVFLEKLFMLNFSKHTYLLNLNKTYIYLIYFYFYLNTSVIPAINISIILDTSIHKFINLSLNMCTYTFITFMLVYIFVSYKLFIKSYLIYKYKFS